MKKFYRKDKDSVIEALTPGWQSGKNIEYCPFDRKHLVGEGLEKLGAQVVDFNFDFYGLQTWEVRG